MIYESEQVVAMLSFHVKRRRKMSDFTPWNSQPLESWAGKCGKGKFIDLEGRSTHYIEKGEGEAVILIHGFFYDSYMWSGKIDSLAEHFKVYAIDLWGCGWVDENGSFSVLNFS
jgi:hypothetical protein